MKCTQIRKHESRFYRRPEVPLKYPPSSERASDEGGDEEEKERSKSRLGATISSLTLILGISAAPVTRDIANYSKCARKLTRLTRDLSNMVRAHPPHSPLPPATLHVAVAALTVTRRSFHGGIDYTSEFKCPRIKCRSRKDRYRIRTAHIIR